jgi:hypothetical protein
VSNEAFEAWLKEAQTKFARVGEDAVRVANTAGAARTAN